MFYSIWDTMKKPSIFYQVTVRLSCYIDLRGQAGSDNLFLDIHGELTYHLGTVATLAAEYKKKRGEKAKQVWRDEQERFWANRLKVQIVIAKSVLGVCYAGLTVFLIARSRLPYCAQVGSRKRRGQATGNT
jgi:hypothetical protein